MGAHRVRMQTCLRRYNGESPPQGRLHNWAFRSEESPRVPLCSMKERLRRGFTGRRYWSGLH